MAAGLASDILTINTSMRIGATSSATWRRSRRRSGESE
jgi:hypothetical protein